MKTYELLKHDTITFDGRTLYRIRALVDYYHNDAVGKGQLGGYIENEENLTEWGWVSENAKVYNRGVVCGASVVGGRTIVAESAVVRDNAVITGDVKLMGSSCVKDYARISGNVILCGDSIAGGDCVITDNVKLSGMARIVGNAFLDGNVEIGGNVFITGDVTLRGDAYIQKQNDFISLTNINDDCDMLTVFKKKDGELSFMLSDNKELHPGWRHPKCFIYNEENFTKFCIENFHNEIANRMINAVQFSKIFVRG